MDAKLEYIAQFFEGVRVSGDSFMAQCPSHKDKSPSLRASMGRDGKVIIRCYAGCSFHEIVSATSLEMADFFPEQSHLDKSLLHAQKKARLAAQQERDDKLIAHCLYASLVNDFDVTVNDWKLYFASVKRLRSGGDYERFRRQLERRYKVCPWQSFKR